MKGLRFIHNPYYPKNFKEYEYLLDALMKEEEYILHQRTKLNIELKKLRDLRKHLLKNPLKSPEPLED